MARDEHAELEATRRWMDGMGFRFDNRERSNAAKRVTRARRVTETWRAKAGFVVRERWTAVRVVGWDLQVIDTDFDTPGKPGATATCMKCKAKFKNPERAEGR
jgi:hypothetical protein